MFIVYDINLSNNTEMRYKFHFSLESANIDLNSRNRNKFFYADIKEVELNQILFNSSIGNEKSLFRINTDEDCESIFQLYKELKFSFLTRQEECIEAYNNYEKKCLKTSEEFSKFEINTNSFNNKMISLYICEASRAKAILDEIEDLNDKGFEEKLNFLQNRLFIKVVKIV